MVTGRVLSSSMLHQLIAEKQFARNFPSAVRLFGTNFIAVRPVPESCMQIMEQLTDPDETIEPNTCYVPEPDVI